jgi:glycosyltransferase involved in cell wall biosynthesis
MVLVAPEHWGKLEVVHCGLDPAEFVPCPSSDRPDPFRVLCVGRLVPEKGQAILIEAIAELCHRGLPIRLTVVGDGPSRQALEALATQRGLDGQVTFTGALGEEEVIARYQDSDALCVPSFAEGLPVVLMEAMALGLPVVTTRISGIAELVEDGTSGFVVPPGRIDLMADALSRLATDPRHRLEMGRAGRAAVAAGYDIASSAQALYGLLRQCPGAVSPASSDQTRLAGQA